MLVIIEHRMGSRLIDHLWVLYSGFFMVVLSHVIRQVLILIALLVGTIVCLRLLTRLIIIIITLNCLSILDNVINLHVGLWLIISKVNFPSSHRGRLRSLFYLLRVDSRCVDLHLLRLLLKSIISIFGSWHREAFVWHWVFMVNCRDRVFIVIHQLWVREVVHRVGSMHRLLLRLSQRFYLAVMFRRVEIRLNWLVMCMNLILVLEILRVV